MTATDYGRIADLVQIAVCVFCVGVIVQTTAFHPSSIFGGRFVTGLGVGSLSMAVPLYKSVSLSYIISMYANYHPAPKLRLLRFVEV